jgi:hypothetical protein
VLAATRLRPWVMGVGELFSSVVVGDIGDHCHSSSDPEVVVVRGSSLFGTSASGALWQQEMRPDSNSPVGVSLRWVSKGGRITMPVRNPWERQMMCGLGGASRSLWRYACESSDNPGWENRDGSYRKMDDGQTIGIANSWSAWLCDGTAHVGLGGRLNQFALADPHSRSAPTIVAGASGSYNPWYQQIDGPDGGWTSLSGGWKPL